MEQLLGSIFRKQMQNIDNDAGSEPKSVCWNFLLPGTADTLQNLRKSVNFLREIIPNFR